MADFKGKTTINATSMPNKKSDGADKNFNIYQEIKLCKKKIWPAGAMERPTLENIVLEHYVSCDEELKKNINESNKLIATYCQSLKELSEIIAYDFDYLSEKIKENVHNDERNHYNNDVNDNDFDKDEEEEDDNYNDESDDEDEDDIDDDDDHLSDISNDDDDDDDEREDIKMYNKNFMEKNQSDLSNVANNSNKSNLIKDTTVIDTTDSSSISSSLDTSLSTETCSDDQVSDNTELTEFKNNNYNSLNKRKETKLDSMNNKFKKQDLQPVLADKVEDNIVNENIENMGSKEKTLATKNSTLLGEGQQFIKIRNREYPISVLHNNDTLINYLRETQPDSLPEKFRNDATTKSDPESKKNQSVENKIANVNHNPSCFRNGQIFQPNSKSEVTNNLIYRPENKRIRRTFNLGKDGKKQDLPSSLCSIEDGLAFFDKKNSTSSVSKNETITLYNNNTSCTLPYPGHCHGREASQNKKSTNPKKTSFDQTALQNSIASQANFSSIQGNHLLSLTESSDYQCSRCRLIDANLKETLKESLINLTDLVTGSIVLNSLISGESISNTSTNFFSDLNDY